MLIRIAQLGLAGWEFSRLVCQLRRANVQFVELARDGEACRIDRIGNLFCLDKRWGEWVD